MTQSPVKVLLVEDSPVALEILQRLLKTSPEIQLVGTARNGKEALELIPKVQPQVICTDLHMKGMNGLELTHHVMSKYPIPILVISNSVQEDDSSNIFELLQAGAIDVFPKPAMGQASDYEKVKARLIAKIRVLSGVSVFRRSPKQPTAVEVAKPIFSHLTTPTKLDPTFAIKVVTIGGSTGGPKALHKILAAIPKNFPVPIICTQHISPGFLQGLVDWLNRESQIAVKIAEKGEFPLPGTFYFAPDGCHLALSSYGKFTFPALEAVDGHCPSVSVMFESVAKFYGRETLGILLTGMGKDGAAGMQAIAQAGGITIAQDEQSCLVFGMPKEAIALGAVKHILPIQDIANFLKKMQEFRSSAV